ncbi:MAG: AmmeMemoRadiSam system protein A [Actinomycetia bacterium]|nr:AmmeMemoRadiSam system protein A [Actinomycetes bacterium]
MDILNLSQDEKKLLIQIAKQSILNAVYGREPTIPDVSSDALNQEYGAFVTLNQQGSLRGCIGNITATSPLRKTVSRMAVEAALHDPRFPAVSPAELKDIDIEISVLSPLEEIDDISRIEVGKHGLLIHKGPYQGLLLPQVATEYGWDREKFLEQTCYKAGLPSDCYRQEDCCIYIFSANVFSEASLAAE